jgi:hypothetical protein
MFENAENSNLRSVLPRLRNSPERFRVEQASNMLKPRTARHQQASCESTVKKGAFSRDGCRKASVFTLRKRWRNGAPRSVE